jgi:hypothetical protein
MEHEDRLGTDMLTVHKDALNPNNKQRMLLAKVSICDKKAYSRPYEGYLHSDEGKVPDDKTNTE